VQAGEKQDDARIDRKARRWFGGLLAVVFAAGGVWLFVSSSQYTTYQLETHDVVSGLIGDSPVEFHGVEVGRVKSVELADPRTIRVFLEVRSDAPVSAATVATITARGVAMRGFTGYVYVALENTGGDSRPLAVLPGKRHPVIASAPSKIVNLDLAMEEMNGNVQALMRLAQGLLDQDTVAALKDSAASLKLVSRTLAENNARLQSLLANAELASRDAPRLMRSTGETMARIDTLLDPPTVASLRELAGSLQRVTGMLADNNSKLATLIANGEEASRDLAPLMQSTHDTIRLLQSQVLPQTHRTLSHLDDLSTTLTGVARKVQRDPSVVIRGASPPTLGPGETK